jgi:hypothetical protein
MIDMIGVRIICSLVKNLRPIFLSLDSGSHLFSKRFLVQGAHSRPTSLEIKGLALVVVLPTILLLINLHHGTGKYFDTTGAAAHVAARRMTLISWPIRIQDSAVIDDAGVGAAGPATHCGIIVSKDRFIQSAERTPTRNRSRKHSTSYW